MSAPTRRTAAAGLVGLFLAVVTLGFGGPAASASAPPFTDENQNGLITLCNAQGQRVTSGSILAQPFIAKAISSSAAPALYNQGLATLYAYQPIKYVDPGDWTGDQLTGSTYFSNPAHPGAESTPSDESLVTFTGVYPLHWHGLMQLRLLYTAPNQEQYPGGYPAAILRVTGKKWTAVEEGTTACNATKTESFEKIALRKSQYAPKDAPSTVTLGTARPTHRAHPKVTGKAHPKGASLPASSSPVADSASDTSGTSGSSGGTKAAVALGVVVVLTAAGGAVVLLRRRNS